MSDRPIVVAEILGSLPPGEHARDRVQDEADALVNRLRKLYADLDECAHGVQASVIRKRITDEEALEARIDALLLRRAVDGDGNPIGEGDTPYCREPECDSPLDEGRHERWLQAGYCVHHFNERQHPTQQKGRDDNE